VPLHRRTHTTPSTRSLRSTDAPRLCCGHALRQPRGPTVWRLRTSGTHYRVAFVTPVRSQRSVLNWKHTLLLRTRDEYTHLHLRTSALTFSWCSFGTKPLSLTVSEIFNGECDVMVDMTLIRPLNKDQGYFLVPIDFTYTTSYKLSIVNFALGRTV